jgi:hypothetical protein
MANVVKLLGLVAQVAKAIAAAAGAAGAVLVTAPQPYTTTTYIQAGVAAVILLATVYAIPNKAPSAPAA